MSYDPHAGQSPAQCAILAHRCNDDSETDEVLMRLVTELARQMARTDHERDIGERAGKPVNLAART
jgi:hypothetical protein